MKKITYTLANSNCRFNKSSSFIFLSYVFWYKCKFISLQI